MKIVVVSSPGKVEITEVDKPIPSPYQALIKTELVALCNATDSKLISGKFPGVDKYPLSLGHENVGIVEAIGSKVENFKVGDRVIGGLNGNFGNINSGWGGFAEYVIANDHEVMVKESIATPEYGWADCFEIQNTIPSDIQPDEAVISCTWREVLGAFKDFNLKPGKKVIIFGSGPVGLSFVKLGKLFGLSQIDIVDMIADKLKLAKTLGADNTYTTEQVNSQKFICQANRKYDAVIDAVGLESIVNCGLSLVKPAGDICVYGVMTKNPSIDLTRAPYNFNIHIHQWPTRSEEKAAMTTLSQWIREGKLSASEFISHRFMMTDIDNALEAIKQGEVIKSVFKF